jgi:hypothetical protein
VGKGGERGRRYARSDVGTNRRGCRGGTESSPAAANLPGPTGSTAAEEGSGAGCGLHRHRGVVGRADHLALITSQIGLIFLWAAVLGVLMSKPVTGLMQRLPRATQNYLSLDYTLGDEGTGERDKAGDVCAVVVVAGCAVLFGGVPAPVVDVFHDLL